MKVWKLWAVCAVLCTCALPALAINREAFTFTKYDLNVRVEPEQQRVAVRGTVTLRNDSNTPQKNAVLQISSSLTWRSLRAGDQLLQFVSQPYVSDIDHTGQLSEAIVSLPKEIPRGGTVELSLAYEGVIVLDATRLTRIGVPKETALHSDWDQISPSFSTVRGVGNVAWYPVATEVGNLSEGSSLFEVVGRWKQREKGASMKASISLTRDNGEASPLLLCNGDGSETSVEASHSQPATLECTYSPIGWTSPAFVVGNYEQLGKASVQIFFRPEHKASAESFAQAADKVTPFVTEWFGPPKEKVAIAELPDPGAAPFEAGRLLLTPLSDTDPKLLQIAMVHELTHAAFASSRPWIYEGLAHFAQAVYRERQDGRQAALDFMGLHRTAIADAEQLSTEAKEPGVEQSLATTALEEFYRSKAAYVWWMLREMLGNEALKHALSAYHTGNDTDFSYMQKLLQQSSGRDLQWFFDDWVYHDRGLPDFRVAAFYPRQTGDSAYVSTVTIENLGGAGAEVPVTVRYDGGEVTHRLEVREKAKATIRFETAGAPTEVVVNDGSVPESDMSNNVFQVASTRK
jgi:hypothetical protein